MHCLKFVFLHLSLCVVCFFSPNQRTIKEGDPFRRVLENQVCCLRIIVYICYSPAGRSVLGKTVPEVSSTAAEGRTRDRGHSFFQYGPTKAGE